ncbi:MAG: DUF6029 family protein [Chitinophagales bacterium]|nr:DUF6029 family protein [Chitinophagales bacterium]
MKYKYSLLLICFIATSIISNAQKTKNKKVELGKLSGSVESNMQYYNEKDDEIGFVAPDERFRSNNYLKIDYTNKGFSAGFQFEAYQPDVILGFPKNLKGNGITNYYASYSSKKFSATIGHYYEQFGSGLLLRSWEDRQLGINNAMFGGRIQYAPTDALTIKAVYGKKRDAYTTGEGVVWGTDVDVNLSNLIKLNEEKSGTIYTGLSYVGKQESYTGVIANFPNVVHLFSIRSSFEKDNFSLNAEYAFRTKDGSINDLGKVINTDRFFTGNVLQLGATISGKTDSWNITLRKVNNFAMYTDRTETSNQLILNYVPALTKQHHFALSNIYVYNARTRFSFSPGNILNSTGEIGGQLEWVKTFQKNSSLGGKTGLQLNVNFAYYAALAFDGTDINTTKIYNFKAGNTNFRDFNIEVKKTWNSKLKTNFSYLNILYNQNIVEGHGNDNVQANILIGETIWKLNKTNSIRADVQHMWVDNDNRGNWAAATIEYTIAPMFNFFVADMYNYGNTLNKVHYYNVGASVTKGSASIIISYGRQREGLLCVGGVCRLVPASTGFSISYSYSF